ncbi:MAG TPA: hypothetical protein DCQ92_04370 [Verrucomicrobia subdivision 3 bacterium]|nr:hypothetical protein [Limisphaerales bacterium]
MKKQSPYWKMSACLAAAALTLIGSVSAVRAAAPALNGSVTLRPLTPTEIKTYNLTNPAAQFSAGISTVGIGEPVYVDAMVNAAIAPSNIVGVVWTLTNRPAGSTAALSAGLLGTNVPLYKTADRISGENSTAVYQLAGRTFFRPDVVGSYTINATITTVGSGTTNLTTKVTGATYLGITACAACHSGAFSGAPSIYPTYTNTAHASYFTRAIDGLVSSHYSKSCISCHTVGYDTNSFANNGGFDDVAAVLGWTFPTVLTNGNWANLPEQLKDVANIQCENCHGPGSQHMFSGGQVGNTNAISISYAAADCGQCHDSLTGHFKNAEWNASLHSRSARQTSPQCVRCHTGPGFVGWATAGGMSAQNMYPTNIIAANAYSTNILTTAPNTTYEAITCQACHDPHDASNPHQLRMGYNVTLSDGTTVTNAGSGGFCMECHNSRNGSVTNMLAKYPLNQPNWAGGVGFGPHDSPQADMLEGVNAITYGQQIPSAPHANVVSNTCAGCHMQTIAATDPAFTKAGGHTFKMSYINTNGIEVPVTYVCSQCHGTVTDFDIPAPDYVGYGYSQGIQTQVQILLNQLSMLLPPKGYQANPANYVADGVVKTINYQWGATNMPTKYLNAAYNYLFVSADGSFGVHNSKYAVGLLKASIANLTGISTAGGLPDAWEIANFGSNFASNPLAGPNAVNNPAGIPNWMMYALGLAPNAGFTVAGSGVIYFNGDNIVNGATNTIAIYTAAEVAFDTVVGTTYQIQGITALTGSWQNIGTNIVGTGSSISYVTPTRGTTQMFFRVVHTP